MSHIPSQLPDTRAGFGALQLMLDQGEPADWFESSAIVAFAVVAVCALVGFVIRELTAREPLLNLSVFNDRNFAVGSFVMLGVGFGFYASTLLLALYAQKILAYDAWTAGTVLAPAGVGNTPSSISAAGEVGLMLRGLGDPCIGKPRSEVREPLTLCAGFRDVEPPARVPPRPSSIPCRSTRSYLRWAWRPRPPLGLRPAHTALTPLA